MGFQYKEISGPLAEKMLRRQNPTIYPDLFAQFGPGNCFLPKYFQEHGDFIENFQVRDNDLWLMSFIKAGTTWTKEMSWLIANDLDYEKAKENTYVRYPYFEFDATWNVASVSDKLKKEDDLSPNSMQIVDSMKSPRFIQTHLPWSMLPKQIRNGEKKPKMIYVARNPKDVCVSFYHHRVLIEGYLGTLDDHVEEFTNDLVLYGPYWPHVKKFWESRHEPNVLFFTYEELKQDLNGVINKTAEFLGKRVSDSEKTKLLHHLSFESMKSNPHVNHDEVTDLLTQIHGVPKQTNFIRKGKIGSWKEELSDSSKQMLDDWYRKNKIDGLWD